MAGYACIVSRGHNMTSINGKYKNDVALRAIAWAGTQIELARRIGCSQATISQWLNTGNLDVTLALTLQRSAKARFKAKEIRPELF